MSLRSRRLAVLSLSLLAALGGTSLFAASASAGPEYYVEGTLLTGSEEMEFVGATTFTLAIPFAGVKCNVLTGKGTIENVSGTGQSSGSFTFYGCTVTGASACTVAEPITLFFDDRLISHNNQIYDAFEQTFPWLTILTFSGESCALAEEVVVKGATSGLVQSGEGTNRTFTFSEATDKLIGSQIFWGATKAFLTGVAEGFLTGTNIGKKWGVK